MRAGVWPREEAVAGQQGNWMYCRRLSQAAHHAPLLSLLAAAYKRRLRRELPACVAWHLAAEVASRTHTHTSGMFRAMDAACLLCLVCVVMFRQAWRVVQLVP